MAKSELTLEMDISGWEDIERFLLNLDASVTPQVVRPALKAGENILMLKGMGFERERNLGHHNPKTKKRAYEYSSWSMKASVGPNGWKANAGWKRPDKWYMHFPEAGTAERFTKKPYIDSLGRYYPKGQKRGKIAAQHMWRDANSKEMARQASLVMESMLSAGIRKAAMNNKYVSITYSPGGRILKIMNTEI